MAAKDLNIRLGILFDQKALSRVENDLRRSGERLSRLGDNLTLAVSAPLAALGAGSIKAAGDLESLTLALQSQLGSAEAARKELATLTEVAKNPGLGLEQVVRASVSLQAVGQSADSAREIITQFGNALALAGKGREEVDGVVLALTQISAKGKVTAEEINQIAERLPQIRTLMKNAFGTASTEDIQKLGITAEQFISGVVKQLQDLPRAQGGIKNSLENTLDSLKQSLAKVGFAINKTFDIAGSAESFGNFVVGLAEGFSRLDPAIKNVVVSLGAMLIAAGPLAKIFGTFQLLSAQIVGGFGAMSAATKALSGWVSATATAFNALNVATRAFVLIGVVTAVTALAYNFGAFNRELTANEKAQEAVNQVQRDAQKAIAGEKVEVDRLIEVINSEVTSREAKARALDKLKAISPQYFGQLREENGLVVGLKESYDLYIQSLLQSARAAAAREKLVEIERQLLDIEDNRLNKIKEAASVSAFLTGSTQTGLQNENALYQKQITELETKRKSLAGVLAANEPLNASTKRSVEISQPYVKAIKEETRALKEKAEAIQTTAPIPNFDQLPSLPTPTSVTSEGSPTTAPKTVDTTGVQQYLTLAEQLGAVNTKMQEGMLGFNAAFSELSKIIQEDGTLMQNVFFGVADAIQQAAVNGASSFAELANAAVGAAAKIVRSWIQQGVAAAVAKALGSLPFPINIAAGAAAGGLASAAFTKAIGAIGVKGFARGTSFAPGGMALVGEQGPELMQIPRGAKIQSNQRTNRLLSGGGNMVEVTGEFRIAGTDLMVVLERAQSKNKRIR